MMNNQKSDVRGSNSSGKLNSSKDFQKYNRRQLNDSGNAYGNGKWPFNTKPPLSYPHSITNLWFV